MGCPCPTDIPLKKCARCDKEVEVPRHRWGTQKATQAGWFFMKDGTSWCPRHNPPWVKQWRAWRAWKASGSPKQAQGDEQ